MKEQLHKIVRELESFGIGKYGFRSHHQRTAFV